LTVTTLEPSSVVECSTWISAALVKSPRDRFSGITGSMLLSAGSKESLDLDTVGSTASVSRAEYVSLAEDVSLVEDSPSVFAASWETSIRGLLAAPSEDSPSEISANRKTSIRGLVAGP
jgi:hypothetical protein